MVGVQVQQGLGAILGCQVVLHDGLRLEGPDTGMQDRVDEFVLGDKILTFQISPGCESGIIDLVQSLGGKLDASGFSPVHVSGFLS